MIFNPNPSQLSILIILLPSMRSKCGRSLYPTVGANLMSDEFDLAFLGAQLQAHSDR